MDLQLVITMLSAPAGILLALAFTFEAFAKLCTATRKALQALRKLRKEVRNWREKSPKKRTKGISRPD
jgi:hypothetical protein